MGLSSCFPHCFGSHDASASLTSSGISSSVSLEQPAEMPVAAMKSLQYTKTTSAGCPTTDGIGLFPSQDTISTSGGGDGHSDYLRVRVRLSGNEQLPQPQSAPPQPPQAPLLRPNSSRPPLLQPRLREPANLISDFSGSLTRLGATVYQGMRCWVRLGAPLVYAHHPCPGDTLPLLSMLQFAACRVPRARATVTSLTLAVYKTNSKMKLSK